MTTNLSCLKCVLRQSCTKNLNSHVRRMANKISDTVVDKTEENKRDEKSKGEIQEAEDLVEPTTCCMSGCANCVWIEYAEKLSKSLEHSSEDVQKIIMDKVQDSNMRAFLSLELRCRKFTQ